MESFDNNFKILQSAIVGFEFEFYSNYNAKETAKLLSKEISKKIVIQTKSNPDVQSHDDIFVLSVDYSGGKDMLELITSPLQYKDARICMIKINNWIKNNGWTTGRSSIHINISFDENKIKLNEKLQNLNILKFILAIDENFIYKYFPYRKGSVYAKSIKYIYPISNAIDINNLDYINAQNIKVTKTKYFGVNFSKLEKGYLEFRYTGGQNYEKKTLSLLTLLDYYILLIFNCLQNNNGYTPAEKLEYKKIIKKYKNISNTLNDYDTFSITFPNIILTIDLKKNKETIKFYWNHIHDSLLLLILYFDFNEGYFNYDSDISKCQVYKAKLESGFDIDNIEFFNCELVGEFKYCIFFNCLVSDSIIKNSNFKINNKIKDSKIINSILEYSNTCENAYIDNMYSIINCKVNGGIIRNGIIGDNAEISKNTKIVKLPNSNKKIKQNTVMNPNQIEQPAINVKIEQNKKQRL